MIRRKRGYLTPVVISVVCWLIFIWLRTFTYMANYNEGTGVYSFLLAVIITMIGTFFYWSLFKPEESEGLISLLFGDELEEYLEETPVGTAKKWSILRKSMFLVGCLAFLCLLAFAFEMWTDITVFTDSTYMDLGFFGINKKYLFDPILFIIFPLWSQTIFRGIREQGYSIKGILSGTVQLLMLSLISYLLFMKLPNIWLIELAAIEIIIVVAAIKKYVWKECSEKKENVLALIGVYVFFWCALLAVFYRPGMTFSQFSYGGDWGAYQDSVRQIIAGASAFGTSSELISNRVVADFLADRNNYFLVGLYYGGWVVGVAIIATLLLFLIASYRLLGVHAVFNRNHLVYKASWWALAMRIIWGIPYSMGIIAMPITLPFAGKIGLYMDTIALGLLIWSVFESRYIDKNFYKNRKISDMFEETEVKIESQETEDLFEPFEFVTVCSGDATLLCSAEEDEKHNALVLEPLETDDACVLIVERVADTEMWHDVEDEAIRNEILRNYTKNNRPDCMEVIE